MAVKALATAGAGLLTGLGSEDAEAGFIKKGLEEIFDVWHGGGDFEKLDMKYIGTGEGTQAYSTGFYTADRDPVSKVYAKNYKNKYNNQAAFNRASLKLDEISRYLDNPNSPDFLFADDKELVSKMNLINEKARNLNYLDVDVAKDIIQGIDLHDEKINTSKEYSLLKFDDVVNYLSEKIKPEHTSNYYLETSLEDYAFIPMAKNPTEAAEMARKAREADGITKEQFAELRHVINYDYKLNPDGSIQTDELGYPIQELSKEGKKVVYKALQEAERFSEDVVRELGLSGKRNAYLYNMEFPTLKREDVMMWDMSISKQPKVRELFKSIADKADDLIDPENMTSSKESALEIFKDIARGGKFDEDMLREIQEYARVSRKEMQGIEDLNDIGAGAATWLMENIFGPKQTAKLLSEGGIKASSHFDRKTRNKYRTVPFNQREDIPENTYNHVIYEEMPINILSKEQIGNADPRLLAAMAASGGAASITSQVNQEALMDKAKSLFSDYLSTTAGALGSALEGLETPQRGLQGLGRTGYGLLTGESLDEALNQGANVIRQGVEKTSQEFGDYIFDKTGSPAAATAGYVGSQFLSPI